MTILNWQRGLRSRYVYNVIDTYWPNTGFYSVSLVIATVILSVSLSAGRNSVCDIDNGKF